VLCGTSTFVPILLQADLQPLKDCGRPLACTPANGRNFALNFTEPPYLRNFMEENPHTATFENQPYTAVGIAVAIDWLLGRMHRPL
jgi:hypothetical protein